MDRISILKTLCEEEQFYLSPVFLKWLEDNNFFGAPASAKYHGVYAGGLFDHSVSMYTRLKDMTKKNGLKWQREQSPFIVGMFHDICKCDRYKAVQDPPKMLMHTFEGVEHEHWPPIRYEYNEDTLLDGHGSKSVMLLSQFITLTEEELLCIRFHMGAYEKDDWKMFDRAIKKYETVMWTHHADMLASKVDDK